MDPYDNYYHLSAKNEDQIQEFITNGTFVQKILLRS